MKKMTLLFLCLTFNVSLLFSWTTPTTISGSGNNLNPTVGVSSAGNAVAVWLFESTSDYFIQASDYDGIGWSPPIIISSDGLNIEPVIKMDASGNAIASWLNIQEENYTIHTASFSPSGGWSSVTVLSQDPINNIPSLAMNSNGQAIIGWINSVQDTVEVATSSDAGVSWSSLPIIVSNTTGDTKQDVSLGIDDSGNAIVVWNSGLTGDVFAAYFNGSWATPVVISEGGNNIFTQVTMSKTGEAIAIWNDSTTLETITAPFWEGVWGAPLAISSSFSPEIRVAAFNTDGFSVWNNLSTGQIESSLYFTGTWSLPVILSTSINNFTPTLSISDTGTAFVAWNSSFLDIEEIEFPSGSTPTFPSQTISALGSGINVNPNLASAGNSAAAVWVNITPTDMVIQVSTN